MCYDFKNGDDNFPASDFIDAFAENQNDEDFDYENQNDDFDDEDFIVEVFLNDNLN